MYTIFFWRQYILPTKKYNAPSTWTVCIQSINGHSLEYKRPLSLMNTIYSFIFTYVFCNNMIIIIIMLLLFYVLRCRAQTTIVYGWKRRERVLNFQMAMPINVWSRYRKKFCCIFYHDELILPLNTMVLIHNTGIRVFLNIIYALDFVLDLKLCRVRLS